MILLYSLIAMLLSAGVFITGRRARGLERRYMRSALQADQLAKDLGRRGGCGLPDPFVAARRQYELGRLVQTRDRLEEKYDVWESRATKFRQIRSRWLNAKGRFVPYLLGIGDVVGVIALMTVGGIIDPAHLHTAFQAARIIVMK
jgi:hypothetical protein